MKDILVEVISERSDNVDITLITPRKLARMTMMMHLCVCVLQFVMAARVGVQQQQQQQQQQDQQQTAENCRRRRLPRQTASPGQSSSDRQISTSKK